MNDTIKFYDDGNVEVLFDKNNRNYFKKDTWKESKDINMMFLRGMTILRANDYFKAYGMITVKDILDWINITDETERSINYGWLSGCDKYVDIEIHVNDELELFVISMNSRKLFEDFDPNKHLKGSSKETIDRINKTINDRIEKENLNVDKDWPRIVEIIKEELGISEKSIVRR